MIMKPSSQQWTTLDELKENLRSSGFDRKAILSDADMARAVMLVERDPHAVETPPDELRYIEGLPNLPVGYISSFKVVPKAGYEKCRCGRVPTALDVIYGALSKQIHSRELVRDTLIGFANVFEFSDDGRRTECYTCGRPVLLARYTRKSNYVYG